VKHINKQTSVSSTEWAPAFKLDRRDRQRKKSKKKLKLKLRVKQKEANVFSSQLLVFL